MSIPVLAFAAIVVVGAAAFVLALRRGRAEQARRAQALRVAAAAHGWSLRMPTGAGGGFELSGRSDDGIDWRLREDATSVTAGERIDPTAVWSTNQVRSAALRLVVHARSVHDRLAGSAGLALADWLVRERPGGSGSGMPLRALLDGGKEVDLGDPALRERFVVVSDDVALPATLLDASARATLKAWPDDQVSIQLGASNLRVQLGFARLDQAAIERMVRLGLQLARAARAGGLSG